jgi:hypothetical protein
MPKRGSRATAIRPRPYLFLNWKSLHTGCLPPSARFLQQQLSQNSSLQRSTIRIVHAGEFNVIKRVDHQVVACAVARTTTALM